MSEDKTKKDETITEKVSLLKPKTPITSTENKEKTPEKHKGKTDEDILLEAITRALEGVMFHNFVMDYFDLLGLQGFRKMHKCQFEDEGDSMCFLKHKYVEYYERLPIVNPTDDNRWIEYSKMRKDISETQLPDLVREGMHWYGDWESKNLEHYLHWKRSTNNREILHDMVEDVLCELKMVEKINDILSEKDYCLEAIKEMDIWLYNNY